MFPSIGPPLGAAGFYFAGEQVEVLAEQFQASTLVTELEPGP
jgi:hypothetical protein